MPAHLRTHLSPAGTVLEAGLAWAVLPTLGWRWLLGLSALPLLLLLAMYPLLPESPVWLVAKGRYAEAEAVLQRVAAWNRYPKPLRLRLAPDAAQPAAAAVVGAGDRLQQQRSGLGPGGSGSRLSMRNSAHSRSRSRSPSRIATAAGQLGVPSPGPLSPLLAPGSDQGAHPELHAGQGSQGGSSLAGTSAGVASAALPLRPTLHRRLKDVVHTLRSAVAIIFGNRLRRTTLLLYCIW